MVSWSGLLANARQKLQVSRKLTKAYLNVMADLITLRTRRRLHKFLQMQPTGWTTTRGWSTLAIGFAIHHSAGGSRESMGPRSASHSSPQHRIGAGPTNRHDGSHRPTSKGPMGRRLCVGRPALYKRFSELNL